MAPGGDTDLGTQTGTTTGLALPDIGGQPANVMVFPKCTPLMGYYLVPGIPDNGPSGKAENYTILMDILWPAASIGKWRSLIQISDVYTNPNSTDGELFVSDGNGIGISGAYAGTLLARYLASRRLCQRGHLVEQIHRWRTRRHPDPGRRRRRLEFRAASQRAWDSVSVTTTTKPNPAC